MTALVSGTATDERNQREKGFTCLETVMGSVVLATALLALTSAATSSMVLDQVAQEANMSLNGAQQIIEQIKSQDFASLKAKKEKDNCFEIKGLKKCIDSPDAKVGKVIVKVLQDGLLELSVEIKWMGCRGNTKQIYRFRMADWRV